MDERKLLREFVGGALCLDGVQMLRFLNTHAGAMTARDIALKLFEDFVSARSAKSRMMDNRFYGAVNASSTPKGKKDVTDFSQNLCLRFNAVVPTAIFAYTQLDYSKSD